MGPACVEGVLVLGPMAELGCWGAVFRGEYEYRPAG